MQEEAAEQQARADSSRKGSRGAVPSDPSASSQAANGTSTAPDSTAEPSKGKSGKKKNKKKGGKGARASNATSQGQTQARAATTEAQPAVTAPDGSLDSGSSQAVRSPPNTTLRQDTAASDKADSLQEEEQPATKHSFELVDTPPDQPASEEEDETEVSEADPSNPWNILSASHARNQPAKPAVPPKAGPPKAPSSQEGTGPSEAGRQPQSQPVREGPSTSGTGAGASSLNNTAKGAAHARKDTSKRTDGQGNEASKQTAGQDGAAAARAQPAPTVRNQAFTAAYAGSRSLTVQALIQVAVKCAPCVPLQGCTGRCQAAVTS